MTGLTLLECSPHARDEAVRHRLQVLVPGLAVLLLAARLITRCPVRDHCSKEANVNIRQRGAEAAAQPPQQSHGRVRCVVDLPGPPIPTVDEEDANIALDVLGVLHVPEGREEVAIDDLTAALHLEVALVVVSLIPDAVRDDQRNGQDQVVHSREGRQHQARPGVRHEEERLVAVEQRHASQVPPAQHPAELLRGDVPRVRDEVLSLRAGVGVEAVGEHHECNRVDTCAQAARRLHHSP
mmetsp:Transcript_17138/g.44102  ORF Transcript_17138/g.44102 Transcript_17138/m.44102 type:complete len:239 (-) Transcript_17138:795-1511(-)